jgi:predicted Zn-dependent protease
MTKDFNIFVKNYLILIASILLLLGCSTSRRQFTPGEIPALESLSSADEQYGHEVLNLMMDQYVLDRNDKNIERVRSIIDKLSLEANSGQLPWHVYVFKDDAFENAAATRGNYIFVWTGILNRVQNDDELAVVLSHEMAHLLAGHTQATPEEEAAMVFSESSGRIAAEVLAQTGGQYGALAGLAGAVAKMIIDSVVVNPEQKRKELEADQIGLFLMAKAKYNPETAIDFWQKMQTSGSGDMGPLQFIATHPSSDERMEQIRSLLPQAVRVKNGELKTPIVSASQNKSTEYNPNSSQPASASSEPYARDTSSTKGAAINNFESEWTVKSARDSESAAGVK